MKETLLQNLVMEAGLCYISDLHDSSQTESVYAAVSRLSPDEYLLEEWEEAVGYILGQKEERFKTSKSAWRFLQQALRKELMIHI